MPRVLNKRQAVYLREENKSFWSTCRKVKLHLGEHILWRSETNTKYAAKWQIDNAKLYKLLVDMDTIIGSYIHGSKAARLLKPHLFTKEGAESLRKDLKDIYIECVGMQRATGNGAKWMANRTKRWRIDNDQLIAMVIKLGKIAYRFSESPTMITDE